MNGTAFTLPRDPSTLPSLNAFLADERGLDPATAAEAARVAAQSAADILRAARAKIEQPEAWGKGRLATNPRTGNSVHPRHRLAACWCAEGAVVAVAPTAAEYLAALGFLSTAVWPARVPSWNDSAFRTHAEVLEGFDKAIALAETAAK